MMKKLLFLLFFIFSLLLPLAAQARLGNFSQRGAASQEMKDDGLSAAHSSLPLNSNVKITNTVNGKEVDVKITNRISVSSSRVIDLSAAAYKALELKPGDVVVVSVSAPPPKVAAAAAESSPTVELVQAPATVQAAAPVVVREQSTPAASEKSAPAEREPSLREGGLQYAYPMPSSSSRTGESEFLAWIMAMSMDARDSREAREERDIRQGREERLAREEREAREARDARLAREEREARETRDARLAREEREAREAMQVRLAREEREAREVREAREIREEREARGREAREEREAKGTKEKVNIIQPPSNETVHHHVKPLPVPEPQQEEKDEPAVWSKSKAVKPVPEPKQEEKNEHAARSKPKKVRPAPVPEVDVQKDPIPVHAVDPVQAFPPPVKPEDVQIVPDLPDRNSGKLYRLQIGAYSAQNTALRAAEYIKSVGFDVELEAAGSIYRVLVKGIAAPDVYSASIKLGALGFGQIWVRE
jgi:hypothetical protein